MLAFRPQQYRVTQHCPVLTPNGRFVHTLHPYLPSRTYTRVVFVLAASPAMQYVNLIVRLYNLPDIRTSIQLETRHRNTSNVCDVVCNIIPVVQSIADTQIGPLSAACRRMPLYACTNVGRTTQTIIIIFNITYYSYRFVSFNLHSK